MKAVGKIRSDLSVTHKRSVRRITGSVLAASLLLGTGQVSSLEVSCETSPVTKLGNVRAVDVVNDTELNTVYGKGELRQGLRVDDGISVILWDEGKRKGHIHESQMVVVTHGQLDVHRIGKP